MTAMDALSDDEQIVLEQALQNPRTGALLNGWIDKKLDEKLGVLQANWELRIGELEILKTKLDGKNDAIELLKEQNQLQASRLTKLQDQFDAKNDEIIALLRQIGLDRK